MNEGALPARKSLHVEFKSDLRKLPDGELVLAAVCLANTEGGKIYLGVEDDGRVTGVHPEHRDITGLAAMIANRTVPPLGIRAQVLQVEGKSVAEIEVPRSTRLVASSTGTLQRRRLLADGTPECVPFLPHEFTTRESDLRLVDYSALPIVDAEETDLDPLERIRLRQAIERCGGDRSLLGLEDSELDGALGLVRIDRNVRRPTVTGLLLIGREASIREHLPTHEVAFQVLEGTEVRVNDFHRWPLIRLFEHIDHQFHSRLSEREVQAGLFRVPVPSVDPRAFREALVNALTHRDYTRLGAVHVRWQPEILSISSPGGFVEGVTLENLLDVEPRPRNPLLADALKRIGLAERTGRGVDIIFQNLLRYGRPPPSYSRSNATGVVVELSSAEADLDFLGLVLDQEQRAGAPMSLDRLIVLSHLRRARRTDATELANLIQKDLPATRAILDRLVESGLVAAHGVKSGRTYTLGAELYRRLGKPSDFVRQAGFDAVQREEMVRRYTREHGAIRRREVMELCGLGPDQATRLLKRMVARKILVEHGARKGAYYELA